MVRKSGPKERGRGVVQEVLKLCAMPSGTEAAELLQVREERHEITRENVENNPQPGKWEVPCRMEGRRRKEKGYGEGCKRLSG